jgi:molybdopterin molybdotransferase
MISLLEARRIIAEAIHPGAKTLVPLAEAGGCVLAEDIPADAAYPSADRAMMDGYAINEEGVGEFRVTAEVRAGEVPSFGIQRGECARIFTGAPVPAGTAFVVPQEDVERTGDVVKVAQRPAKKFIRARGVEAKEGDVVLACGSKLGPAELAILAQVGAANVPVFPPAGVCHMATGDELTSPDEAAQPGKIRDTNSSLIAALVANAGGLLISQARCGDDPQRLREWVDECEGEVLLLSGGASVGDYDFGARVLREAGFTIHFDKVSLRPGKPLIFATREGQCAFVIPGNPVSHFVCFHVAIRLALERIQGAAPHWETIDIELGGEEPLRADPRETWWPARVQVRSGRLVAEPRRWSSSGDTFSLAGTNGLIRVVGDAKPGGVVPVLLLDLPH